MKQNAATPIEVDKIQGTKRVYPHDQIIALAENIRVKGLRHPIAVSPSMKLLHGGLRLAACRLLKLPTIDARVLTLDRAQTDLLPFDDDLQRPWRSKVRLAQLIEGRWHVWQAHNSKHTSRKFESDVATLLGVTCRTVRRLRRLKNLSDATVQLLRGCRYAADLPELTQLAQKPPRMQETIAAALAGKLVWEGDSAPIPHVAAPRVRKRSPAPASTIVAPTPPTSALASTPSSLEPPIEEAVPVGEDIFFSQEVWEGWDAEQKAEGWKQYLWWERSGRDRSWQKRRPPGPKPT